MIAIYSLTPIGESLAHSIRNPSTLEWRLIHHLSRQGQATKDQLVSLFGFGAIRALVELKHKGVVTETKGTEV